MMLEVGKTYLSNVGNLVQIDRQENFLFIGTVIDPIEEMIGLKNRVHRFNEQGEWLSPQNVFMIDSLHNLKDATKKRKKYKRKSSISS